MNTKNLVPICLILLCVSGCQTATHSLIKSENMPGHRFTQTINPKKELTTIVQTRKGVIVYKDNVIYNTTSINPNSGVFRPSSTVSFGPGSVSFGPNRKY